MSLLARQMNKAAQLFNKLLPYLRFEFMRKGHEPNSADIETWMDDGNSFTGFNTKAYDTFICIICLLKFRPDKPISL